MLSNKKEDISLSYILSGLLVLLIGSFFDNTRGPLIPVFVHRLNLDYANAGFFLVVGSFTAVFATAALIPLIEKYGTRQVTLCMGALGLVTVGFSYLVHGFFSLMIFAVLVGGTAAVGGGLCNVLIMEGSSHLHRARLMCLLHMMYGIGSLIAPLTVSFVTDRGYQWPTVFFLVSFALLLLIVGVKQTLPRSDPIPTANSLNKGDQNYDQSLSKDAGLKILVLLAFCTYVTGEVMTSMWMVTYLVEGQKLAVSNAAPYLTVFFVVMALSRGICFLSIKPQHEHWILSTCLFLSLIMIVVGRSGRLWGFSLAGIMGPYFPIFLGRLSRSFPDVAKRLTLWILTIVQLTLAAFHLGVGKLTDAVGISYSYWLSPILILIALILLLIYFIFEKKHLKLSVS